MKHKNTFSLSEEVFIGMQKVYENTGIPKSQQIERAWAQVYGREGKKK
ncbi:MAG: hypothetical protein WCI04_05830 [archaeon]